MRLCERTAADTDLDITTHDAMATLCLHSRIFELAYVEYFYNYEFRSTASGSQIRERALLLLSGVGARASRFMVVWTLHFSSDC